MWPAAAADNFRQRTSRRCRRGWQRIGNKLSYIIVERFNYGHPQVLSFFNGFSFFKIRLRLPLSSLASHPARVHSISPRQQRWTKDD